MWEEIRTCVEENQTGIDALNVIDCDFEICKKFEIGLFIFMYTVLYILMWWQSLSN